MKTIIAGCRNYHNIYGLYSAIEDIDWEITSVVSGGANGADKLGEIYANNKNLPLTIIPAQWNKFGKAAGRLRNIEMAEQSEALIALWDGNSRGSKSMIEIAKVGDIPTYIYYV